MLLDDGLSDAHLAIAQIRRWLEWQWSAAEVEYAEARRLNPGNAAAHAARATLLLLLGLHDGARAAARLACNLDPDAPESHVAAAWLDYVSLDYEGAVRSCRAALGLRPLHVEAQRLLAIIGVQSGREQQSLLEVEAALPPYGDEPALISCLAYAHATLGNRERANEQITRLVALARRRPVSFWHLALAYMALDDPYSAVRALSRACADRDPRVEEVATAPHFAVLRAHPEYPS